MRLGSLQSYVRTAVIPRNKRAKGRRIICHADSRDHLLTHKFRKTSQSLWRMTVIVISVSNGQLGSKIRRSCSHKKDELSNLLNRMWSTGLFNHRSQPLRKSMGIIAKLSSSWAKGVPSYMCLRRAWNRPIQQKASISIMDDTFSSSARRFIWRLSSFEIWRRASQIAQSSTSARGGSQERNFLLRTATP